MVGSDRGRGCVIIFPMFLPQRVEAAVALVVSVYRCFPHQPTPKLSYCCMAECPEIAD